MRVLFMGTPDIATGCLQKLIDENYNIIGVVTQPDKPQNRGKKLGMPPVKELALKYDNDNPYFQNSLAYAYVQLEQYDSAIELYKKALEANPNDEWPPLPCPASG